MLTAKLWLEFIAQLLRIGGRSSSPFSLDDTEMLGRAIFSSGNIVSSKKKVRRTAFQPPKEKRDLSVTRTSRILRQWANEIGRRHLRRRRGVTQFYGYAEIAVYEVQAAGLTAKCSPTLSNPYHADIRFPADTAKDAQIDLARRLADRAVFVPAS